MRRRKGKLVLRHWASASVLRLRRLNLLHVLGVQDQISLSPQDDLEESQQAESLLSVLGVFSLFGYNVAFWI